MFNNADLSAAVAGGIISKDQAANLRALLSALPLGALWDRLPPGAGLAAR
ncbi:MAG: hypothetical protein AAGE89_09250 [Pseudomonadota bacterium]